MDAQISITLPKTEKAEETVTITFNAKTFRSGNLLTGSYPTFGNASVAAKSTSATQVVYEFKTKTTEDLTLTLDATNKNASTWGDINVAIDGKVSQFVVTNNPEKDSKTHVLNYITSLSFKNNGELKELVLAKGQAYETTGLPNLKELSCSGNKLIWIPAKPTNMEASKYNIGTQILDVTLSGSPTNSKEGVSFSVSNLQVSGVSGMVFSSLEGYNITNAKDKVGNAVTVKKVADNKFVFTKGDIFFDGELTFDVEVTDTNYPGVIISGVKTTISAPMFTLKKDNLKFDSKQGTITSNINFDDSKEG